MSLGMRWVGDDELDRVAGTRLQCFGLANKDLSRYRDILDYDGRGKPGDYLLAEQDGQAVGTATSFSMNMWLRGGRVPCQGVAWVGTLRTHRRSTSGPGGGVASRVMREVLRAAHERELVVSALMPFRASFYEHFGYGVVERRCTWNVPLAILPTGGFEGMRLFEGADMEAVAACRQRGVQSGQCDIERSLGGWPVFLKKLDDTFVIVDRAAEGIVRGYLAFQHAAQPGKDAVVITEQVYEDIAALRRQLHFLASLRDQYAYASLTLPADVPLNWLLREVQVPHRPVNHATAEVRFVTRMQLRVLDSKRLIESMHLPTDRAGRVVVAVTECEGGVRRFAIDVAGGRASVMRSDATPTFECADRVWAAVVTGDVPASQAVRMGMATATTDAAARVLDVFTEGPAPFCQEYF